MNEIYSVTSVGHDVEKLKFAFHLATALAIKHNVGVTIVVPIKKDLEASLLADVLGRAFIKRLLKSEPCTINDTVPLHLLSSKNAPLTMSGVLLTIWTTAEMLGLVEGYLKLQTIQAVIVQSSNPAEVEAWCESKGAKKAEAPQPDPSK